MHHNNRTKVAAGGSIVDTDNLSAGKAVQLDAMKGNILCAVKDADRNEIVFMCGYAPCY